MSGKVTPLNNPCFRKTVWLAAVLYAAVGAFPSPGFAARSEPPPSDNTRLSFKKTLFVHNTKDMKIFAETRKIQAGDSLWKILKKKRK